MSVGSQAAIEPSHEQIRVAAYHIYLHNGCENGHAWDHWFRAEQLLRDQLREQYQTESSTTAASSEVDGSVSSQTVRSRQLTRTHGHSDHGKKAGSRHSRPAHKRARPALAH
jgi:hypothetical protein